MKKVIQKGNEELISYTKVTPDVTMYVSDDGLYKSIHESETRRYEDISLIEHEKIFLNAIDDIYGCDAYRVKDEAQRLMFEKYFHTPFWKEEVRIPIGEWFLYKVEDNGDFAPTYSFYSLSSIIEYAKGDLDTLIALENEEVSANTYLRCREE